jgi:putative endonuclease
MSVKCSSRGGSMIKLRKISGNVLIRSWYVYVLESICSDFIYIGSTHCVLKRLDEHNNRKVRSTKHFAPYIVVLVISLPTEEMARELEKYFKTGSGNAILKKRFLSPRRDYHPQKPKYLR